MQSNAADATTAAVVAGLQQLGYADSLLERDYSFPDWFAGGKTIRTLDAAAFGQTPVSYESACIGVAKANGLREAALVDSFRGFGAPILLEVDNNEVREWAVSRLPDKHSLIGRYQSTELPAVFADRSRDWTRGTLMRAKNIGSFRWLEQLGLFSGLIPELESQIQNKLDPLLRDALARTSEAYVSSTRRKPNPRDLFRLVFWMLTAKVFRDRQVPGFLSLKGDPNQALLAVARQYQGRNSELLNPEARHVAAACVWRDLDFRHLSVEVLAHIWSRTLVDPDAKKRLGIHRTPRSIVRYIVEQIPFDDVAEDKIVFEPCSGSAAFLIGALNYLRPNLNLASAQERHRYFVNHLAGVEYDPFGVEISMLALTLADFPNPNGWKIERADVFAPKAMTDYLRRSAAVLCNPPFESLPAEDRKEYGTKEIKKPAALLRQVLADLHPRGVLGFVLPYNFADGRSYSAIRKAIAERFASVQITILPERSFEDADTDVALLIATDPIPHANSRVVVRRVYDDPDAWMRFDREHALSSENAETFTTDRACVGLVLAELPEVWTALDNHRTLSTVADIHRGIEWKHRFNPQLHLRSISTEGYRLGVPPKAKFFAFQIPQLKYLNVDPKEQRRPAWKQDWSKSKAIVPKIRVSRGRWRMVAFPDSIGLACPQSFFGVWPKFDDCDEILLAAIINSPVANAFVATREGNRDVTKQTLDMIPVPSFSPKQRQRLHSLVSSYQSGLGQLALDGSNDQELLLKEIDAIVLDGYHLPPRIERRLLDFFNYEERRVQHDFGNYFPESFDVHIPLSQYLNPRFRTSNMSELVKTLNANEG